MSRSDGNFCPGLGGPGGLGAWQVGLRYDHFNANSGGLRAGELDALTVGLNWYWTPNARLMMNYAYTHLDIGSKNPYDLKASLYNSKEVLDGLALPPVMSATTKNKDKSQSKLSFAAKSTKDVTIGTAAKAEADKTSAHPLSIFLDLTKENMEPSTAARAEKRLNTQGICDGDDASRRKRPRLD